MLSLHQKQHQIEWGKWEFIDNIWGHKWPARESGKKSILGLVNHAEQASKVNRKQKSEQNIKNSTKKDGGKWKTTHIHLDM